MSIRRKLGTVAATVLCLCGLAIAQPGAEEPAGDPSPVWLGVLIDDESLDGGIQLVAVVPGGPAERAGLARGDVLLKADGRGLLRSADLERVLSRRTPGDTVVLELLRGGRPLDRRVLLAPPRESSWAALAAAAQAEASLPARATGATVVATAASKYGFSVAEVTPDLRVYYGAPAEIGVLVTGVDPGQAAHRAGLRVGDVLLELGPVRVERSVDVDEALEAWRTGEEAFVARVVRDNLKAAVRFDALGGDRARSESRVPPGAPVAFEMLERSIELEIERLNHRIAELERRLKRLRDDRESGDR